MYLGTDGPPLNFCAYSQLSQYPARDPLYLLDNTAGRGDSRLSLPDMLLLSCCFGMGIGTARDEHRALGYCVKAGLNGYIPAILTAVSLFDVYQQSTQARSGAQLTMHDGFAGLTLLDLETIIEKWKNSKWDDAFIDSLSEADKVTDCRATLPIAFTQTSAARGVCRKYLDIGTKIYATTCTCTGRLEGKMDMLDGRCGWQLLNVLAYQLESGANPRDSLITGFRNSFSSPDLLESFDGILSTATSFEDSDGQTLLHYVAACLNWDQQTLTILIDILVSAGVKPALRSRDEACLIVRAIRAGNESVALHLLKEHYALSVKDLQETCREAIFAGEWAILHELLKINDESPQGERVCIDGLLIFLCSIPRFHRDITGVDCFSMAGVDVMIQYGGNISYCDDQKRSPLMAALKAGNSDLAEYILLRINSTAGVPSETVVPLNRQVLSEQDLQYLNNVDNEGENALSEAIRVGNVAMIVALLRLNVDTEWKFDGNQLSALQVACQTSRYIDSSNVIEELLARGTNALDIEDERGNTILHYLAFGTNGLDTERAMDGLLNCTSSAKELVNKRNKEGQTALHFAVSAGIVMNVKYLLKNGAHVGAADIRGYTTLHLATDDLRENSYEILSVLLIECDEYILNLQDQWGRTALMHAAGKLPPADKHGKDVNGNEVGMGVLLLLQKGASVVIRDNFGQNVLHHYYGRRAENEFHGWCFSGISILMHLNQILRNLDGIDFALADFDPFYLCSGELGSNSVKLGPQGFALRKWYMWIMARRPGLRIRGIKESRDYGGKAPRQYYYAKLDFLQKGKNPTRSGLKARVLFWFWITLAVTLCIAMAWISLISFGIPALRRGCMNPFFVYCVP